MLKILQRANWEDLQLMTSMIQKAPSIERGITHLWNAYMVTGKAGTKTDKEQWTETSDAMGSFIDENNVISFLSDRNVDLSVSSGSDKYKDGESNRKLQRSKELKAISDV